MIRRILIAFTLIGYSISVSAQIEPQRAPNWCWASCIQSLIYQAYGEYYSQSAIAFDLDGWPRDRPAHINEVAWLLQGYGFKAWRAGRPGNPYELYHSLVSGWKLIAFVRPSGGAIGHYIVLQGLDQNGNIKVSDPSFGTNRYVPLVELYFGWRWEDSIVVGL